MRRGRSPVGSPRSKASENRKDTTKISSIAALATIFIVFLYVMFIYYDDEPTRFATAVDPNDVVRFITEFGNIRVVLRPDVAPRAVAHFKELVSSGFYDGCGFYRAEKGFVLQGGGTKLDGTRKVSPLKPILFEYGLLNEQGTLAMARTEDIDSANSEYFFNLADNSEALGVKEGNPGYTAFGDVAIGYELLEKISQFPTVEEGGLRILKEVVPVTIKLESELM